MSLRKRFGFFAIAFACAAVPLAAQPTTTQTCTTAPVNVQSLNFERVLTLNSVVSATTPNIDAAMLAAITSGALEVRERLIFNSQANTLTSTVFTVAPGSPSLTPLSTNIAAATLSAYTISINSILTSCSPTPSVLIVGTITSAATNGVFGNLNGAPAAVSIGYTTANPAQINNVVTVVAGQVAAYSPAATGTLTFPAVTVTPPGTSGGNPTLVISPAPPASGGSLQVFQNNFKVDVSGSTDPSNLPLTYSFSSSKPALFLPSNNSPTPTIQFQSGAGDYIITVTATNSAGGKSTSMFTLTYLGH